MQISSNTLFHFTNHYDYFIDSLKHGLWPRYNIETCWNGMNFVVPMVCFCDIPLSQIQNHVNRYGMYGIGVTKEFAKRNDLTPVLYVDASSKLKTKYLDEFLSKYTLPSTNEDSIKFSEMMLYYIKRVEGIETKKDKSGKEKQVHVKYYNEREWRYIPSISKTIHLEIDGKTTQKTCKELSKQTKNNRLLLEPNDIQYLIVRSDNMSLKLYEDIGKIFHSFPPKDINLLRTKIIYNQQIKKDF